MPDPCDSSYRSLPRYNRGEMDRSCSRAETKAYGFSPRQGTRGARHAACHPRLVFFTLDPPSESHFTFDYFAVPRLFQLIFALLSPDPLPSASFHARQPRSLSICQRLGATINERLLSTLASRLPLVSLQRRASRYARIPPIRRIIRALDPPRGLSPRIRALSQHASATVQSSSRQETCVSRQIGQPPARDGYLRGAAASRRNDQPSFSEMEQYRGCNAF